MYKMPSPSKAPVPDFSTDRHTSRQPQWINRFANLSGDFGCAVDPTPVPNPVWVARNTELLAQMGLPLDWLESSQALQAFSGNALLPGSQHWASVFSGHQFGQWAGQLGDGRALYLGELRTPTGSMELQLKGAGRTPFSRMGDGRAVLRSSIREYLCSQAMQGLGIPTTLALCLTGSPLSVIRETAETAAIVTRTAPSFIRFGHFEHFSSAPPHQGSSALKLLADFVIDHHLPESQSPGFCQNRYANLLHCVTQKTAALMAQWQAVGFCHGVMNTDNMSILGLTLDYGPFQFLDAFDPMHICNHSDHQGRYAYQRQPQVGYWNLFCLAQALMPLIEDQDLAVKVLETYKTSFAQAIDAAMLAKLGLSGVNPAGGKLYQPADISEEDRALQQDAWQLLAEDRVDYTLFWRRLSHAAASNNSQDPNWQSVQDLFIDRSAWQAWQLRYMNRISHEDSCDVSQRMLQANPKYTLRNHLAELAIQKAQNNDFSEVDRLHSLLQFPFDEHPEFESYAGLPPDWAASIEISCSS